MKKVLKKILILFLIILILNNFWIGCGYVHAAYQVGDVLNVFTGVVGGVVGILTWPLRLIAILAGNAINSLTALIAYVDGATDGNSVEDYITPFDIFFNKVKLFDINFFDIPSDNSIVSQMRTSIAGWYYAMRIIASSILLIILIYVGIRMAISTVASDRAMYKKMLVDWVASLAIIFVLHYIMIFAITVNNTIVNAISLSVNSEQISNVYKNLKSMSLGSISLDSLAATAIYCMIVWQTFALVISYFNRMLKLAFLVVIAPLVTLTYSIDKMGDGKAQGLEAWLKEFVFTILIQPFHCVIYMCFIDVAFNILVTKSGMSGISDGGGALAASIVAILCVKFTKEGEKIVRKIFAFKDDNSQTSIAAGTAAAALAINKSKSFGKSTAKAVNNAKDIGKNASNIIRNGKVEALALKNMVSSKDGDKSFSDYKEEASIQLAEKEEAKALEKTPDKYKLSDSDYKNKIKDETAKIKDLHPGMSDKEAKAIARSNVAKQMRKSSTAVGRRIKGAKTKINNAKAKVSNSTIGQAITEMRESETGKMIKDFNKASINAGIGFMVGSGLYGVTGNLASSISMGVSTANSIEGFMSSSTKTITKGITTNMKALGIKTGADARNLMKSISGEAEKYDGSDKTKEEVKKIIDDLVKAAQEINSSKDYSGIKNNIKTALESPLTAPDAIKSLLMQNGIDANSSEAKNLLDYSNKKSIYSQMQNSDAAGISQTNLMESIDKAFGTSGEMETTLPVNPVSDVEAIMDESHDISEEYDMSKYTDEQYSEIKSYENEIEENSERINELKKKEALTEEEEKEKARLEEENEFFEKTIKDMESEDSDIMKRQAELNEEFERFTEEIDDEISRQYESLTELEPSSETYKEITSKIEKLKVEQASIISKRMNNDKSYLEGLGNNMARKYQRKLDEAISMLEKKSEAAKSTKDYAKYDKRIADLQEVNANLIDNINKVEK